MNIVEKEAIEFYDWELYKGLNTLSEIKSRVTFKLYDFNRDRDKLDFLKILHKRTTDELGLHGPNCNCDHDVDRKTCLFVIEQEIES